MLEVITRNEKKCDSYSIWVVEIQDRDENGHIKNMMRIDVLSQQEADELVRVISESGTNIAAAGFAIITNLKK